MKLVTKLQQCYPLASKPGVSKNGINLDLNTHQIACNIETSIVRIAAAQSFVPLLAHVLLQRCTVFEYFLTVKAFQTVQTSNMLHISRHYSQSLQVRLL